MSLRRNIVLAAVALVAMQGAARATITTPPMRGNTESSIWPTGTFTSDTYFGYGAFPGNGNWPAPIVSVQGNGDAGIYKTANGSGGGPFISSESIYNGGFSVTPNTLGGSLAVRDTTPLTNVKNVIFQIDIAQALGYDFYNGVFPVLRVNGAGTTSVSTRSLQVEQVQIGTFDAPDLGEQPLYLTTWLFQWDVTQVAPVTSLSVEFSSVQHSQIYAVRLDEADVLLAPPAVVPEPAMLGVGLGVMGLGLRRRR